MSFSCSETLEMMGPSVEWVKVKERILSEPKEASTCPLPCPPLQFALVNEAAPIPLDVVKVFLELNPASLEELWFKVSVIAICKNKRIKGEVLDLFLKKGPSKSLESIVGKNLIYNAIMCENVEVIRVLVKHFPWVLSGRLESDKCIPLHYCLNSSPHILKTVLEEGIRGGIEKVGGLFIENNQGETFFNDLIMTFASSANVDDEPYAAKWKRLEICLKYIYHLMKDSGQSKGIPSVIPFCCICFLPSHLLKEGLRKLQFDVHQSDIYDMIDISTSKYGISKLQLSYCDLARMIGKILPLIQSRFNQKNNVKQQVSPLQYGACRGLRWDSGLREIFLSDVDALWIPDKMTNLKPFMAAACSPRSDLNTIYELLLSGPSIMNQDTEISPLK